MSIILSLIFLFQFDALAEPWLANKYAQNCASCHAPSRINRPLRDRRCTLSCQACHTNPSGGGLRNHYGKWTQNRWLKSFGESQKSLKPKPWFRHKSAKKEDIDRLVRYLGGKVAPKPSQGTKTPSIFNSKGKLNREPNQFFSKSIPSTMTEKYEKVLQGVDRAELLSKLKGLDKSNPDWLYTRNNGDIRGLLEAQTLDEFEENIPEEDPYRLRKKGGVSAAMEFRYQYWNSQSNNRSELWPMTFDIGVSYRPSEWLNNLVGVVEGRFANFPGLSDIEHQFTSQSRARSAYLLWDRLPYNGFVMHGLYRPMFEHYNPDHNSLAQLLVHGSAGQAYNVVNKATTIGIAPNVPFVNLTYLQPTQSTLYGQDEGFILNTGLRFVTLGASLVYSYWDTKTKGTELKKQMHSLQGGMKYKRWIGNVEFLRFTKEFAAGADDTGSAVSLENRFQMWRENYFELNYAFSNTALDLKKGEGLQYSVGVRSFLYNTINMSLAYRITKNSPTATAETENKEILWQLHGYLY